MSVKSKEEIIALVRERLGELTDDETIAFLEDITDTFNDMESKIKGDGTDWKAKYEENDAEWRKKYTERFFSSDPNNEPEQFEPEEHAKPTTFDELFTTD